MTTTARDQFEVSHKGITHKPTGYTFTPYPHDATSGNVRLGQLGNVLPSGEDYRPHEVEHMARELWAAYCAEHDLK